ncbi:SRF-like protein [Heliocybe sulcata]|uniref:SRF-like protein n=1 Tax=Heliocybe sulcata TaxID=5364 RepID=A0A5C3MSM7_9AGAM|nr:SRF-like protein [Heliocybe sulcata]
MGRRKIEIQPITTERNRSITFQKRKNGLFKKAYELGVLCSVDIAVVIFERGRSGEVKCYDYSSNDLPDTIMRRMSVRLCKLSRPCAPCPLMYLASWTVPRPNGDSLSKGFQG